MTEERMALASLLQMSGDGDFLRTVAEAVLQILMEADVEGLIGAGRRERTGDRISSLLPFLQAFSRLSASTTMCWYTGTRYGCSITNLGVGILL